jgi:hypothetical protein
MPKTEQTKKGQRSIEFNEGYAAAVKDLTEDKNLDLFIEGYKAGFQAGYGALLMQLKDMPAEMKEKMGDGAQPWTMQW